MVPKKINIIGILSLFQFYFGRTIRITCAGNHQTLKPDASIPRRVDAGVMSCQFPITQYGSLKISLSVSRLFGFNVMSPVWLDILSEYMAALTAGKEFFILL